MSTAQSGRATSPTQQRVGFPVMPGSRTSVERCGASRPAVAITSATTGDCGQTRSLRVHGALPQEGNTYESG
jgi:hypothetical protein